ncbi:CaiB/BaiF CoA transferase family protein [Paraburkholderia bryophila]|uniref:Crotonobetainyl-CoA:carnitine CoA-transferase CaiB-like acyl-CoA transferase n=1 Tax=Paraburkholderia bryophila TaxID=420952 RepID=A0A329BIG5_9BURK|nr:CoA transferase [Paraburkholderia bryophila]RAS17756.1 crotonobetainyl-CoA:carnitine CoA-transferase CaiB-like acyl-CoA transferase [Paraburkholderia bryophila]
MSGPLAGVRIIDLTTVVMGPSATQILGDLGADVIKVESAGGDSMRHIGPMRNPGMGPLFLQANRNKRSIVLDLKAEADMHQLRELIRNADVLISNIRPQAMARLGLSYESATELNPSIIFCSTVGYGEGGPYAGAAVYDDLMQAASGVAGMFERVDGKPRYAPINLCDRVVGLYAAIAVQAALYNRQQTGEGQQVEVPMFETMAQFVLADHIGGRAFVPPLGDTGYLRLLSRSRGPYPTADGYLSLVVYTDAHWRKFSRMIGRPSLVDEDERFRSLQTRTTHAEAAGQLLADELPKKTTAEWLAAFHAADIPACRVNSVDDLFDDPHLHAVAFFRQMEHPSEGTVMVPRSPLNFSATPLEINRLAPTLGEHTGELGAKAYPADSLPTPG